MQPIRGILRQGDSLQRTRDALAYLVYIRDKQAEYFIDNPRAVAYVDGLLKQGIRYPPTNASTSTGQFFILLMSPTRLELLSWRSLGACRCSDGAFDVAERLQFVEQACDAFVKTSLPQLVRLGIVTKA